MPWHRWNRDNILPDGSDMIAVRCEFVCFVLIFFLWLLFPSNVTYCICLSRYSAPKPIWIKQKNKQHTQTTKKKKKHANTQCFDKNSYSIVLISTVILVFDECDCNSIVKSRYKIKTHQMPRETIQIETMMEKNKFCAIFRCDYFDVFFFLNFIPLRFECLCAYSISWEAKKKKK